MGTVGGMTGKEKHMHNEGHYGREGHKEGKFGASSHHTYAGNHSANAGGTHIDNNHSAKHVHKKVPGHTGAHTGSESKAHAIESMHKGKMPNNR